MPSSHAHEARSLPTYAPLQLDASGTFHLLVAQTDALDALEAFLRTLAERVRANALALLPGEPAQPTGIATRCFRTGQALERAMRQHMTDGKVGLRVYLCGDEAFLWRMRRIATEAGLLGEEIRAAVSGACRSVYCVHCGATGDYPSDDEVICAGCGLRLAVRQHFSSRLGAYLGACAAPDTGNAENRA